MCCVMTKISVLIVTHNRLEWLKEAILSVFDYTSDAEMLILANGCTDGTNEYLMEISNQRVKTAYREENLRDGYQVLMNMVNNPGGYGVLLADDD